MKKVDNTIFYNTFVGEHVSLVTNIPLTQDKHTEEGILSQSIPLSLEGILMDMDDRFFFLGAGDIVTHAVKIDEVILIEIMQEEHPLDQVFDMMDDVDPTKMN